MVKLVNGLVEVFIIVIRILINSGFNVLCGILLLLFVNVIISFIRMEVIMILINVVCYILIVGEGNVLKILVSCRFFRLLCII